MKKLRSINSDPKSKRASKYPSKMSSMILAAAAIVVAVVVTAVTYTESSHGASASANFVPTPENQKRYVATRRIAIDRETGQPRMPTKQEVDELVATLKTLANRPESLPSSALQNGATAVDLEGGFNGVMLARPNADGGLETRCVFTFEEGAEFLGLVEENS